GEQEQPHHVDKVPIPGGRLEAEMLLRREVPRQGAEEADRKEDGPDYDVETVKSRRHEERGAVDRIAERERCVDVLISLHAGKQHAKCYGECYILDQLSEIILQERVV